MAFPVSQAFKNAQVADVNLPASKVQLLLGNYFSSPAYGSTIASNGDDGSGNYPAAGAIDGDRTEINVGAASGADNGAGKSSWRSAGSVSPGSPGVLTITLTKSRTLNRLKVYHLSTNYLTSYDLRYFNGSTWVVFAATSDIVAAGQVSITTTHKVDTVDFSDIAATQWRMQVYGAQGGTVADLTEIEAYRKVDITSRVKSVRVSRQRDYKLANPMAAKLSLVCNNDDRFFSISHSPSAAEIASGFVNSELNPNIQVAVSFGFLYSGGSSSPELVSSIAAYVDSLTLMPKTRDCKIEARDATKLLINQQDSTNLKSNLDISGCIQYVLNRANISNWEMSLDSTGITIPYFLTDQQDQLSTIRDLVQASGDALFWFDESGIATFRYYTSNTPVQWIYPVQTDWSSGTFTGDALQDGSDHLALPLLYGNNKSFTPGTLATHHLQVGTVTPQSIAQSFQVPYTVILSNISITLIVDILTQYTLFVWNDNGGAPGTVVASTTQNSDSSGNLPVNWNPNVTLNAGKYWYGVVNETGLNREIGLANVSNPSAQTFPMMDAPYGTALANAPGFVANWSILKDIDAGTNVKNFGTYSWEGQSGAGTWQAPTLDANGITVWGVLGISQVLNGGTISYQTRTSPDGSTWSAWLGLGVNNQILSPVNRYIQTLVTLTAGTTGSVPTVNSITVNWTITGSTSPKYPAAPASWTFSFASNLLDVQQEISDNLSGDTSILNDVIINAAPLLLQGSDSNVVWQGTTGAPPVNISGAAPLSVTNGQVLTYPIYVPGGMDTSRMSGASPAAAAITFASSATGTWKFTQIHPTLPVLQITITHDGTITNLQVEGKTFASGVITASASQVQSTAQGIESTSAVSIAAYGRRKLNISNQWIVSSAMASAMATALLNNFATPFSYIPEVKLQPMFASQIGDRVTVVDSNLDLSADYAIVGLEHTFSVKDETAEINTASTLLAIPAGF